MNIKSLITTGIAAAMLITGVATVGAQDDTPTPPSDETTTLQQGNGPFGGRGDRGGRFGDRIRGLDLNVSLRDLQELVTEYTGLEGEDLRTAMQESTLAELIEANGQSVDAFVTEATAPLIERIDQAVADGDLTEEQGEELKTRVTERLTERVNNAFNRGDRGGPFSGNRGGIMRNIDGELVETYTGLTLEEVREELRNGVTLAELIEANGASVDEFIAEAVVTGEAAIDERAATAKENLEDRITAAVNGERPERPMPPVTEEGSN
jgi:sulfur carrier protein ThiS